MNPLQLVEKKLFNIKLTKIELQTKKSILFGKNIGTELHICFKFNRNITII